MFAVLILLVLLVGACKGKPGDTLAIGSKDFTESYILAELYALALEKHGYKTELKLNLGGTNITHAAILKGDLQIYPEYTGTCLINVLQLPMISNPREVYDKVSKQYKEKYHLILLDPASANNTEALAISAKASRQYGIVSISQLQLQAQHIRFASQGAFDKNADGMPALKAAYGNFAFKSVEYFDNAIKYELIKNDIVDLVVAFGTDGQLADPDFVLLEDDRHVWPPYNIVPVVREDVLDEHPDIADILNALSSKLDNKTMRLLNAGVDIQKREPSEVAKEYFEAL
jgi:osmoprotectant transport system substrate-binding protein